MQNIEGNYYNSAGELHTVFDKYDLTATLLLTDPDLTGMWTPCFYVLTHMNMLLHVDE